MMRSTSSYSPVILTTGRPLRLRVWWIPQVPMMSFDVLLDSFVAAKVLLRSLAMYDLFQYEQNIKPDFANVGGLCIWEDELDADAKGEKWITWETEECDGFDTVSLAQCFDLDEKYRQVPA